MNESFDITTIIFAVLAIFVVFKLRSVLGTRTGNERPPSDPFSRKKASDQSGSRDSDSNVIPLPGAGQDAPQAQAAAPKDRWEAIAEAAAWPGLDEIAAADRAFDGRSFIEGARSAYEMIVSAFAKGDRNSLRGLLSQDVLESFTGAIAARESRGETAETTLVSIEKSLISDAHLRDKTAQVTVRFAAKLITATRNASGEVVDGNAERVVDIVDIWTFARVAGARDPNWKLVATESSH